MRILTADAQPVVRENGGHYRAFVERLAQTYWNAPVNWSVHGSVMAYVNQSAWAAACPFCPNHQVVEPGQPFFCVNCMMQGNGFLAMAVSFPPNRAEIEAILLKRRSPNTRNWLLGETADDLRRENWTHGEA
jgi:hypothetical protein